MRKENPWITTEVHRRAYLLTKTAETVYSKKDFEPMDLNKFDFLTNPGGKPVE
jgi:hypothetical protein